MTKQLAAGIGGTPTRWQIIFSEACDTTWLMRLPVGRFKHVAALGLVPEHGIWLLYDVSLGRTAIHSIRDDAAGEIAIAQLMHGKEVLSIPSFVSRARVSRLGFWCVPAVCHLVGLSSCALRPDALHRLLLASGAEIVQRAPGIRDVQFVDAAAEQGG